MNINQFEPKDWNNMEACFPRKTIAKVVAGMTSISLNLHSVKQNYPLKRPDYWKFSASSARTMPSIKLIIFFGMWRLPGLRASCQDISWRRNANRWRSALQHLWSILFGYHEVPQKNPPSGPQFPSKVHLDPCCIQATGVLKMRARSGAFPKIDGFWKIARFR